MGPPRLPRGKAGDAGQEEAMRARDHAEPHRPLRKGEGTCAPDEGGARPVPVPVSG